MLQLKNITLFLILEIFLLSFQSVFAQNFESVVIEYQQKMETDEDKIAKFPESMKEIVRAKTKWTPAILTHNNNGSQYVPQNNIESKTIQINQDSEITSIPGNHTLLKDFDSNLSYEKIQMYDEVVIIKDTLNIYKWQLESDTKTIMDLKCKKATTIDRNENEIIVWYTETLGINNGPNDLHGLPGLVVYAEGGKYSYKLSKVNFRNKKIELPKLYNDGIIVTPEEYRDLYSNNLKNETTEFGTTRRTVKN